MNASIPSKTIVTHSTRRCLSWQAALKITIRPTTTLALNTTTEKTDQTKLETKDTASDDVILFFRIQHLWESIRLLFTCSLFYQCTSSIEKVVLLFLIYGWYFLLTQSREKVHWLIWLALSLTGIAPHQVVSELWRGGGAVGGAALAAVSPGRRQHDEASH